MSDLIDRGDLLDTLDELEEEWEDAALRPSYFEAKRAIKNAKAVEIPTGYNVEKVVERLAELFKYHYATKTVRELVLEIVRNGGKE